LFYLSSLLFVDDILIFREGTFRLVEHLNELLKIFYKATEMLIKKEKYSLITWGLNEQEEDQFSHLLSFRTGDIGSSLKYLGFFLKANNY